MARFRFVHAADIHLDTPFDGLSRLGGEVPELLRDASLQAWDNLVAETLRVDATFLLLSGDIYDGPERGLRAQIRFRDGLRRLSEAGVRVFMVHGNHDPLQDGWSAVREWPQGVTVFGPGSVQAEPVLLDGQEVARVHGISYARRDTTENLSTLFPDRREGPLAIGMLHCNVGNNAEHAAYSPCSASDLKAKAVDYWALGHIHRFGAVLEGGPWAVYPGALQGRSPKPSETGPKGAVVVDVEGDRIANVAFRALDVVRFESRALDIGELEDLTALHDSLLELGEAARVEADGRQVIFRARLEGRGSVHEELARLPDGIADLTRELREDAGRTVLWERVVDRSSPPIDKDAIRRRGDFSSELLARAEALLDDETALLAFVAKHCQPNDHRLSRIVESVDVEEARDIVRLAIDEALDRLEPKEIA